MRVLLVLVLLLTSGCCSFCPKEPPTVCPDIPKLVVPDRPALETVNLKTGDSPSMVMRALSIDLSQCTRYADELLLLIDPIKVK